jgi:hypothetical protein
MPSLEDQQKAICQKYKADYIPADSNEIAGVSKHFDPSQLPINGLRHPKQGDTSGWYIWTGQLDDAEDFFQPQHIKHLPELSPEVIAYLGLPPGWRFLIGEKGYVDVWYDESLLNV